MNCSSAKSVQLNQLNWFNLVQLNQMNWFSSAQLNQFDWFSLVQFSSVQSVSCCWGNRCARTVQLFQLSFTRSLTLNSTHSQLNRSILFTEVIDRLLICTRSMSSGKEVRARADCIVFSQLSDEGKHFIVFNLSLACFIICYSNLTILNIERLKAIRRSLGLRNQKRAQTCSSVDWVLWIQLSGFSSVDSVSQ